MSDANQVKFPVPFKCKSGIFNKHGLLVCLNSRNLLSMDLENIEFVKMTFLRSN